MNSYLCTLYSGGSPILRCERSGEKPRLVYLDFCHEFGLPLGEAPESSAQAAWGRLSTGARVVVRHIEPAQQAA